MTDSEAVNCSAFDAEAVLVALGGVLHWELIDGTNVHEGQFGHFVYRILKVADVGPEDKTCGVVQESPRFHIADSRFPSPELAKAACERHYATGKWE